MSLLDVGQAAGGRPAAPREEEISRSAFARLVEVSPSAVTQAVGKGRLTGRALGSGKKLVLPWALKQWRERRDPQADLKPETASGAEGPDRDLPGDDDRWGGEYRDERTRKARAERQLRELELAEKLDQLRPKAEVVRAMTTCGRRIADRLQSLPASADEIAALGGDAAQIRNLLKGWVRTFREQMTAELLGLAEAAEDGEGGGDGDDDGDPGAGEGGGGGLA